MPKRCGGFPKTEKAPPSTKQHGGDGGAATQAADDGANQLAHQRTGTGWHRHAGHVLELITRVSLLQLKFL
jgi:hypothetical protein